MLTLSIHHNVHLTREQRYALHAQENISVTGICIPVWSMNLITSEPAKEVFCRYHLTNPNEEIPIRIVEDGFHLTIPYREGQPLQMSDEDWRYLNLNNPDVLSHKYQETVPEVSSKNLLDLADGGLGQLTYRERVKMRQNDVLITIMHHVTIGSMESLLETI